MNRNKNITWGIFFIIAAILVVLNKTSLLVGLNFWNVIITILLIPVIINSGRTLNFFGIFFPLALISILFSEPLGIEDFTPWTVLAAALFLSIGFTLIFPRKREIPSAYTQNVNPNVCPDPSKSAYAAQSDDYVNINARFSGAAKTLTSQSLKGVRIDASFASVKVYLDKTRIDANGAEILILSEFSGIELYIPADCQVVRGVNATLSGVDEKGRTGVPKNGGYIELKGDARFSGITVIYV